MIWCSSNEMSHTLSSIERLLSCQLWYFWYGVDKLVWNVYAIKDLKAQKLRSWEILLPLESWYRSSNYLISAHPIEILGVWRRCCRLPPPSTAQTGLLNGRRMDGPPVDMQLHIISRLLVRPVSDLQNSECNVRLEWIFNTVTAVVGWCAWKSRYRRSLSLFYLHEFAESNRIDVIRIFS